MRKKAAALLFLAAALTAGCGNDRETELTDEQLRTVYDASGMLARNLAYLPDQEGWSAMPDSATMTELELLSLEHVDLWPRFFRAAADTSLKLQQLEEQAIQEELQMELL